MINFRLPFRRRARGATTRTTAERITTYLDSSSRDIAFGLPAPWNQVSTALSTLEADRTITAHWTWGPVPRQRLYRLADTNTSTPPRPTGPRSEPSHSMRLDAVALTLVRSNGRTAGDVVNILGLEYSTALGLLRELETAGRVTCHDEGDGILRWRLALPPIAASAPQFDPTHTDNQPPQPRRTEAHP